MSGPHDVEDVPLERRDSALAAEYVLRLLGPAEDAACVAREYADPGFAAEVALWQADLSALDAHYRPVKPPAALRGRVEARLFGARPSALRRVWASAGLWRGLAALATALAVWLALPLLRAGPDAPVPRLVSALAPAEGTAEFLAVFEPDARALSLNRVAGGAAPGRALELWVIAGEAPPVSLGVLPQDPLARLALPEEFAELLEAGAVLAVTDEPAGGSPTGGPTGPVLSAGPLREI